MYVARYEGETGDLSQVGLRFGYVFEGERESPGPWAASRAHAVEGLLDVGLAGASLRVTVRGEACERALWIAVPRRRESEGLAAATRLAALDAISPGSVEACEDRRQHDALLAAFPPLRARVRCESHRHAAGRLAHGFRVSSCLDSLLSDALGRGTTLAYQAILWRYEPGLEETRRLRKNLAGLEAEGGVPGRVLDLQRALSDAHAGGAFLLEEYVGFDDETARGVARERIEERFAATLGRLGFPGDVLEDETSGEFLEAVSSGLPCAPPAEDDPFARAAAAVTVADACALLAYAPPRGTGRLVNLRRDAAEGPDFVRRIERRLDGIEAMLKGRDVDVSQCTELRRALGILKADPPFSLVKSRQILEGIVDRVFRDHRPGQGTKPLFNMIEELAAGGRAFPPQIATYLHTIRVIGNLVVHAPAADADGARARRPLTDADVEVTLLMILHVVEWYLTSYEPPRSP